MQMRIRETRGFQDAVRAFDRERWEHRYGTRSVQHTMLHLIDGICATLTRKRSGLQINREAFDQLPGRLLEHAARLANNCNASVLLKCTHARDLMVMIDFDRSATVHRAETTPHAPENVTARGGHIAYLLEQLGPAMRAIERLDHGEPLARYRRILLQAASVLIQEAFILGPIGQTRHVVGHNDQEALELFLSPLAERLALLRRRRRAYAA